MAPRFSIIEFTFLSTSQRTVTLVPTYSAVPAGWISISEVIPSAEARNWDSIVPVTTSETDGGGRGVAPGFSAIRLEKHRPSQALASQPP